MAEPAGPPGDETHDGLGEEELVAPAEGLEEGRQRGRSGLWQADPDEVEPPGGQGDGTPFSPHQLPRLTPSRRDRSEATLGLSIGHLPGSTAYTPADPS